jgi:dihydrofolate reductase
LRNLPRPVAIVKTESAVENTRLLASDGALAALKDEPGDPLRVIGSLSLVRRLMGRSLVDRLRLMVFPQVLGVSGARAPVQAGREDA